MAAWKSGSLADKIKGQAAASPAPTQAPAATSAPSAAPVASQAAPAERKPQTSPLPAGGKAPSKNGTISPEPSKAPVEPVPVAEVAPARDGARSPRTLTPPPEAKATKEDAPKASQPKPKAEVKPVDEAPPKPSSSHGPAAVAAVDVVKDEPIARTVTPPSTKAELAAHQTNGPTPSDSVPAPARPIESPDEPLVTLPLNIATLVDKRFAFVGAIAPPPTPVVPIMPQPAKRSVDPVSAPPFAAPPYARPTAPIPPNYDAYQQQYAHQGYPNNAPVYGQSGYGQAGYTPGYGYAPRGGGRGAYQTGLFNLPPYERGFRGAGYGGPNYNASYRGNAHYGAPPYYPNPNGYRAPEEADGTQ